MSFFHTKVETFGFISFSEDTVVVTGFGPFGNYKINASWEAVKLLPSMNIEEEFGVKLIIHEIPVTYEYVAENVPALWKVHNPMVCILSGFLQTSVIHSISFLLLIFIGHAPQLMNGQAGHMLQ
jgi:hypothetical protein